MKNKKLVLTSIALYFTYFVHGVGASILSQYKPEFAHAWGGSVGSVVAVIAALGLGRLISLPFAGPLSDKFGRRISGLIGIGLYVVFFVGIAFSPSMTIGYIFGIIGGCANSFLDTCVTPTCMEIYVNNGSVANMFTKFSIVMAQFILPYAIGWVSTANMSYRTIFIVMGIAIAIDAIFVAILPFPEANKVEAGSAKPVASGKMKFTPASIAAICLGFTSSSTFMLWLNCNQELGSAYGMADPSKIQSFYAVGSLIAILLTGFLITKGLKETYVLILYPSLCVVALLVAYFVHNGTVLQIVGFVIGFAGAGGVLQIANAVTCRFFPTSKAKATSMIMIASSIANYTILSFASWITANCGAKAPGEIILLNVGVTIIGILLAVFIMVQLPKEEAANA